MSAPNTTTVVTKAQTWKFITAMVLIPLVLVFFLNSIFTAKREAETSEQARVQREYARNNPPVECRMVTASEQTLAVQLRDIEGHVYSLTPKYADYAYIMHCYEIGPENKLVWKFDITIPTEKDALANNWSGHRGEGVDAVSFQMVAGNPDCLVKFTRRWK